MTLQSYSIIGQVKLECGVFKKKGGGGDKGWGWGGGGLLLTS